MLYSHAAAFTCVSNYEGFGFPPLEAMQCGTPVIASDISAHRWVLGDACAVLQSLRPGIDRGGDRTAARLARRGRAANTTGGFAVMNASSDTAPIAAVSGGSIC